MILFKGKIDILLFIGFFRFPCKQNIMPLISYEKKKGEKSTIYKHLKHKRKELTL